MMKRRLLHGYVVTTSGGRPAASGCVWLREMQPSPGHPHGMVPYVLSVYTRPEFRRKGLASMIVEEAMEWARKHGYYKVVLHASKTGRKVYSQLGWKRTWEMEFRYDSSAKPRAAHAGEAPSACQAFKTCQLTPASTATAINARLRPENSIGMFLPAPKVCTTIRKIAPMERSPW